MRWVRATFVPSRAFGRSIDWHCSQRADDIRTEIAHRPLPLRPCELLTVGQGPFHERAHLIGIGVEEQSVRQHDVFLAYSSVKHYNFLFVPALASSEPMTQHRWERMIPRALRRRAFQTRSRTGHLSPPFIAYRAGAADWRIPGRAEPPHRGPARPHPRMLTGAAPRLPPGSRRATITPRRDVPPIAVLDLWPAIRAPGRSPARRRGLHKLTLPIRWAGRIKALMPCA